MGKIRRESQEAYERKDHKFVLLPSLLPDYLQLGGLTLTPMSTATGRIHISFSIICI
jgi:hypothetical protein